MVRVGAGADSSRALYEHTLARSADDPPPMPTLEPDPDAKPFSARTQDEAGARPSAASPSPSCRRPGPARARAVQLTPGAVPRDGRRTSPSRSWCPPRLPATQPSCGGEAALTGARRARTFDVPPGAARRLRFRLTVRAWRALRHRGAARVRVTATTLDASPGGTGAQLAFRVRAPAAERPQPAVAPVADRVRTGRTTGSGIRPEARRSARSR